MSEMAVACERLRKTYGSVVAVADLTLTRATRRVLRPARPERGRQDDDDRDPRRTADAGCRRRRSARAAVGAPATELRQRLGIQLQETQLPDKLTVEETLRLFRSFYTRGRTVEELLADRRARKQAHAAASASCRAARSSGCRSPVRWPAIPTCCSSTSRRPDSTRSRGGSSGTLLEAFRARGGTILMTTHYMEEAEFLCDRVAIVDHGRIIALGDAGGADCAARRAEGRHPPRHARGRLHVADRTASAR